MYVEKDCAYCHNILGRGGRREGPDLSNVLAKDRSKEWLVKYIEDPKAVNPWSTMPKYDLTKAELDALAEFMLSLDFDRYDPRTISRAAVVGEESS